MLPMTLADVAAVIGAKPCAEPATPVTGVSIDSRTTRRGELFFALDGARAKGEAYVADAIESGASGAVTHGAGAFGGTVLKVADSGRALMDLGRNLRGRLEIPVIAITGSNGKTTTKNALRAILEERFRVVASPHSYNNRIGVPLTLASVASDTEVVVLECGTNAPGEIKELSELSSPTAAIITGIHAAHVEGLSGLDGILEEKLSISAGMRPPRKLYLNHDDPRLSVIRAEDFEGGIEVVQTGFEAGADVRGYDPEWNEDGVSFRLTPEGEVLKAPLAGRHNLGNLLLAAAVARDLGLSAAEIAAGMRRIRPAPMRFEDREVGGIRVTFDCYNANPASMAAALVAWGGRPRAGRRVAVIGDMLELGAETKARHEELGRLLAAFDFDHIVLAGRAVSATAAALTQAGVPATRVTQVDDVVSGRATILDLLRPGDRVLLKGSRGMALERLFDGGGC